ncbi:acyl-CoA thioesterase [Propionicicella superfundia]|uniref:acyl-CoA thioesterase n=1 Tax=Propionicicella superfundia TaxID=348582 RepID=UPI0003F5D615|nr:acyl-CoA thioesterase II [Propionicicella superfundia]
MPASVDELLAELELERLSHWRFRARPHRTTLQRVFGGQVLAQCLGALHQTVPEDRWNHSFHGYFLRPGAVDQPIDYDVEALRDGRSFTTRRVTAWQGGKDIFTMITSSHVTEPGLDHFDTVPAGIPAPEECPPLAEVLGRQTTGGPERWLAEWGALDVRFIGASGPDGTIPAHSHASHLRVWVRASAALPADPVVHQQLVAYASDVTLLSSSVVNHRATFVSDRLQVASLDHAMWFPRPIRADDWWLYDQISPSAHHALGIGQGRIFQDDRLSALCVQEGLIRPLDPTLLP